MMKGRNMLRSSVLLMTLLSIGTQLPEPPKTEVNKFRDDLRDKLKEHNLTLVSVLPDRHSPHLRWRILFYYRQASETESRVIGVSKIEYTLEASRQLAIDIVMAHYDAKIDSGNYSSQEIYGVLGRSDFLKCLEESWPLPATTL